MTKHLRRSNSISALAIAVGAVVLFVLGAYGLTRLVSQGEVMGRVEVAGTPLGGLDREQALTALVAVEDEFVSRPAIFNVEGKVVSLQPAEVGLDIDEEAIVDQAMAIGRRGSHLSQFGWWLQHIFTTVQVPVRGGIDPALAEEVFDVWDGEVIAQPARHGGVALNEEGDPVPDYPQSGTGVDRPAAGAIITSTLLAVDPDRATIPTTTIVPELTDADVDAAVAEARLLLAGPITLVHDDTEVVFTPDQLTEAFRSETMRESPVRIVNTFDPEVVDTHLAEVRSRVEAEPVNARFVIEGDSIEIAPGRNGTLVDPEETARRLAEAARTPSRRAELPLMEGAEPEVTTEALEALDIRHLVSQFTTYYECCQPRVTNIHTIAGAVGGAIVGAGETFSLNGHVGPRTEEKGYLPGGTIVAGELEDTIGGGVSQFATTLYNAVYWGGYEDVEHKPHSYYFSRYPEGIEATVSWRSPDLKFRNDTDGAILIDTRYTDTSITVRIFGNNDGRTLKGEQSGGRTKVWVDAEGGPNALHVKSDRSDRYAFTDPPPPRYKANPELGVDEQRQTQSEAGGWSVTVTRRILLGGDENQVVQTREWVVRYAPRFAVLEVHPCKVPGTSVTCPTTTTTAPTPTTTAPAETTTSTETSG